MLIYKCILHLKILNTTLSIIAKFDDVLYSLFRNLSSDRGKHLRIKNNPNNKFRV